MLTQSGILHFLLFSIDFFFLFRYHLPSKWKRSPAFLGDRDLLRRDGRHLLCSILWDLSFLPAWEGELRPLASPMDWLWSSLTEQHMEECSWEFLCPSPWPPPPKPLISPIFHRDFPSHPRLSKGGLHGGYPRGALVHPWAAFQAQGDAEHLWGERTTTHTWPIPSKRQNVQRDNFQRLLSGKSSWERRTSLPVSFSSQPDVDLIWNLQMKGRRRGGEEPQTDLLTEYLLK